MKNRDFHLKSVAIEARKRGGPAEQTIRNAAGADYRAVIDAFAQVVDGSTRQRAASAGYDETLADRIAAHITDSQLRAEIALLLAEHRSLKRQIDILRASTSKGMLIKIDTHGREPGGNVAVNLTDVQLEALRHFLDDANLRDNDWVIEDDGRILTENGREVTRFGFVDAIKAILAQYG